MNLYVPPAGGLQADLLSSRNGSRSSKDIAFTALRWGRPSPVLGLHPQASAGVLKPPFSFTSLLKAQST